MIRKVIGATVMVAAMVTSASASEVAVETIDGEFPMNPGDRIPTENITAFGEDETATFQVKKGERLSETLQRWCELVGYDLVWQPDPEEGDLKMAGSLTFQKSFKQAAREFTEVFSDQSKFDAQLHPNKVLRVFIAGE